MTQRLPFPATVADIRHLSQAEHLVVFGFRAVALGYADCPVVHRTFQGLLGAEGEAALSHLFVFARLVGAAAGRRLRLHPPGCCGLGEDERRVLAAIAAAQASLTRGDDTALAAGLRRLAGAPPDDALMVAARGFAAALTLAGVDLRTARDRCATTLATLH